MLAQLMKLPFRRDSIEKVLQDNLRRGLTPNLQLCGQLAASLGLRDGGKGAIRGKDASAGAVNGALEKRLCPCGGQSREGSDPCFAGTAWSPRSSELEDNFPEGIELLLMERSNATPDQGSARAGSGRR